MIGAKAGLSLDAAARSNQPAKRRYQPAECPKLQVILEPVLSIGEGTVGRKDLTQRYSGRCLAGTLTALFPHPNLDKILDLLTDRLG